MFFLFLIFINFFHVTPRNPLYKILVIISILIKYNLVVITMDKKLTKIKNIILPSKKTNYFIITILILGLISGSVFLMVLNETDKTSVLNQIQTFFTNIDTSNINSGLAF